MAIKLTMVENSADYLPLVNAAQVGIAREDFMGHFIGILSCYVPREIWVHAVEAARDAINIPAASERCPECGDIFASHIHSGVKGGHAFKGELLNPLSAKIETTKAAQAEESEAGEA